MSAATLRSGLDNILGMAVSVVTLMFINLALFITLHELFVP